MTPRWIIGPALAVCLIAYAQVVSGPGLALWVAPSALIALGSVAAVRARFATAAGRLAVWPVLLATTAGWAFVVETLGGQTSGPVTRASLLVGGLAGAMSAMLLTRYAAAFAVPAVGLFCGALALGAAGGLLALTGAFAVALLWGFLALGPYRAIDLHDRQRLTTIAVLLLLAGLVAVAGTAVSSAWLTTPWTVPGAGSDNMGVTGVTPTAAPTTTVEPSVGDPSAPSSDVESERPSNGARPQPTSAPTSVDVTPIDTAANSILRALRETVLPLLVKALLVVALLLLLWLVYQLARRAWATARWRAMRRRLRAGSPNDRVLGAWAWVRLRLHQAQRDLPPSFSPDVVASGLTVGGLPDPAIAELTKLARLTAAAAFSPDRAASVTALRRADGARAWGLARDVELSLTRLRTLRQWWRFTAYPPDERILRNGGGEGAVADRGTGPSVEHAAS